MRPRREPSFIARRRPHRSPAMTPVLVRPARSVDSADLAQLAALDSAAPLTGGEIGRAHV